MEKFEGDAEAWHSAAALLRRRTNTNGGRKRIDV